MFTQCSLVNMTAVYIGTQSDMSTLATAVAGCVKWTINLVVKLAGMNLIKGPSSSA